MNGEHAADEPRNPDHLQQAAQGFQQRVLEGIQRAYERQGEIDEGTARMIAHALGRALGSDSALAEFARTGAGTYRTLGDEYLQLYMEPTTPPMIKEWIDWLGTYIVGNQADGSGRRFMSEHDPPTLARLLVPTSLDVAGKLILTHVPADVDDTGLDALATSLQRAGAHTDPALRAFLSHSDVDANSATLVESFHAAFVGAFRSVKEALLGLSDLQEWERELGEFALERGLPPAAVSIDVGMIESITRDVYDIVTIDGVIYAFDK